MSTVLIVVAGIATGAVFSWSVTRTWKVRVPIAAAVVVGVVTLMAQDANTPLFIVGYCGSLVAGDLVRWWRGKTTRTETGDRLDAPYEGDPRD